MLECAVRAQGSYPTGAVPWRHMLGSWLWRAGHAGVGDRHAPRRRDTGILFLARRSKYHLSIWPLSRGELIPRLDKFIFFSVSQFLLQVLSRSFAPLPPSLDFSSFFLTLVEGYFLLCQGLLLMPVFSNVKEKSSQSKISSRLLAYAYTSL